MAEVFGIVGTAIQLVSFCGSMGSLLQDIRTSKSGLHRYLQLVEELQIIVSKIKSTSVLHTPHIAALIDSILETVSIIDLQAWLQKRRIGRTWTLLTNKGYLIDIFQVIERKKITLSLHMQLVHAEVLHDIQIDISAMGKSSQEKTSKKEKTGHKKNSPKAALPDRKTQTSYTDAKQSSELLPTSSLELSGQTLVDPYVEFHPGAIDAKLSPNRCTSLAAPMKNASGFQYKDNYKGRVVNNTFNGEGTSVNGIHYKKSEAAKVCDTSDVLFEGNVVTAESKADQINGVWDQTTEGDNAPEIRGDYVGNTHNGIGNQVNGIQFG